MFTPSLDVGGTAPVGDLRALMVEIAATISGAHVEVGSSPVRRHVEWFIKLTSLTDANTWATVSTSGSGFYELTVDGGYWTGTADDQAAFPAEVREYLESYVRAALAYLDGSWSMRRSRFLKVPTLSIQRDGSVLNLAPRGRGSTNDCRLSF